MHIILGRRRLNALRTLLGLLVAVVAALLAASASPPPGKAAFPGANGKIAFTSNRDGNYEIYVMNADGSGQTNLTNNPAFDGSSAAWSPDGTKIAFSSDRDGNNEIYVMNADGSGQTRLTNNPAYDSLPAWSPDGTKIAFTQNGSFGVTEIYVMNADGSGQAQITSSGIISAKPAWSPDASKIAFSRGVVAGDEEVYVMNPDGSGQTDLTNKPSSLEYDPAWAPDGSKIVFVGRAGVTNPEIFVMNADGSGPQTNLTTTANFITDVDPAWSPDGSKIAFTSDRASPGVGEIYVMNADGSGQTNLTNNPAVEGNPDWQPLDVTPPTITITTPPEGDVYNLGQVVLADYACEDQVGGTGVASCVGNVAHGSAIDTGSVGAKTFTVDAEDNAGNPASDTHHYSVIYSFSGFFQPVDNPGPGPSFVFNVAKAGSAIPVKFSLSGNQGLGIFAAGYPKSQPISCSTSATYDAIEETVTAGSSSLSYDATTDRYLYVWKTDKVWANTCRKLTVRLIDGTDHIAYFNFKK